jgi:hypothetical protein
MVGSVAHGASSSGRPPPAGPAGDAAPLAARCPACGVLLPADARWCLGCGTDLRDRLVELVPVHDAPPMTARHGPPWLAALAVALVALLAVDGVTALRVARGCRPGAGAPAASPLLRRCSGTVLLLDAGGGGMQVLDLDAGRVSAVRDPRVTSRLPGTAALAPTGGRVPVVDAGRAWAVPVVGRRAALDLGPAISVLADTDGGWWLVAPAGSEVHGLADTTARRVTGAGARGPEILLGPGVTPVLGVAGSLLVEGDDDRIALVGGALRGPVAPDLGAVVPLAAGGRTLLVEADPPGRARGLWTVDVGSGRERYVGSGAAVSPGMVGGSPAAKFSPDGRWLAVFLPYGQGDGFDRLVLVDLRTGSSRAVPGGGTAASRPSLGWSPDGKWVFFTQAGGPVDRTIGAYRIGDRRAGVVNFFPGPIVDLVGTGR